MKNIVLIMAILALISESCKKPEIENIDIRDKYVGIWDFIEYSRRWDYIKGFHGDTTISYKGTIACGAGDKTLIIIYGSHSFIVTLITDNAFKFENWNNRSKGSFSGSNGLNFQWDSGGLAYTTLLTVSGRR